MKFFPSISMCRWGCQTVDTTYMCKWCGTRYCGECLRGDFIGLMRSLETCRICFQDNCQGQRVEFDPHRSTKSPEKSQKSEPARRKKSKGKRKLGKKRRK